MQACDGSPPEAGQVVKLGQHNTAYVELKKTVRCQGCKACAFGASKNKIVLPALVETPCKKGDLVLVAPPARPVVGASLVLYVLPLALIALALIIGSLLHAPETLLFVAALIGLAVGVAMIYAIDKMVIRRKRIARIIQNLTKENENDRPEADCGT